MLSNQRAHSPNSSSGKPLLPTGRGSFQHHLPNLPGFSKYAPLDPQSAKVRFTVAL